MVRVALTGTPGVGKTTLAAELARRGWTVLDLNAWARTHDLVVGHDDKDGSDILDMSALAAVPLPDADRLVVDGHLAHLLPVDEVWVVRCDPAVVEKRLQARGYPAAKVAENREAEAMDLILQEALAQGSRVRQRDGTTRSPAELAEAFSPPLSEHDDALKQHDLEAVDWSHRLLDN